MWLILIGFMIMREKPGDNKEIKLSLSELSSILKNRHICFTMNSEYSTRNIL